MAPAPGSKGKRVITVPDVASTCLTVWGLIGSPSRITPPGAATTMFCPIKPSGPCGAQPIHPGPEYQLTKAGENIDDPPGIQNQPKPLEKFQLP